MGKRRQGTRLYFWRLSSGLAEPQRPAISPPTDASSHHAGVRTWHTLAIYGRVELVRSAPQMKWTAARIEHIKPIHDNPRRTGQVGRSMNMLLIALITLIARVGAAQQPGASIEGVVVKLGTGEPLANASVQLNLEDSQDRRSESAERGADSARPREDFHRTAKSDTNGRFIFANVAPGNYRLIATYEGGYVPAEYGQRSPTGQGINFEIAGRCGSARPLEQHAGRSGLERGTGSDFNRNQFEVARNIDEFLAAACPYRPSSRAPRNHPLTTI